MFKFDNLEIWPFYYKIQIHLQKIVREPSGTRSGRLNRKHRRMLGLFFLFRHGPTYRLTRTLCLNLNVHSCECKMITIFDTDAKIELRNPMDFRFHKTWSTWSIHYQILDPNYYWDGECTHKHDTNVYKMGVCISKQNSKNRFYTSLLEFKCHLEMFYIIPVTYLTQRLHGNRRDMTM